jgi:hypothetical protein
MTVPPGKEDAKELYPFVGAIAAALGDRDPSTGATYTSFLASAQPNYPANPWFFLDQPLSDLGWVAANAGGPGAATPSGTGLQPAASSSSSSGKGKGENGGARVILLDSAGRVVLAAVVLVLVHVLLFA